MDVRVTQRRRLGSAVRSVAVMVVASLSVSASYGGLGRAVFASSQKEGEAVRKAGRSVTRLVTEDMKLESTTTNLERTLKDAGLNVELQRGELPSIGIDVTLDRKPTPPAPKDPPTTPTPTPVTPPLPPPLTRPRPRPPGPSPFIELETYRIGLEQFRAKLEEKRAQGELSSQDYEQWLGEYRRRIRLYQAGAKLFEARDER